MKHIWYCWIAIWFSLPVLAAEQELPPLAQPSFIYKDGGKIVVHDLRLKEVMPGRSPNTGKPRFARHWQVENRKAVKWTGGMGSRILVLPDLNKMALPEDVWRAKLLPGTSINTFLVAVNKGLSGKGKYGNPLGLYKDGDGKYIMTAFGHGDGVYSEMQKVSDAVDAQLRAHLASPFRAVYAGYLKWRLSEDGASGAPVLVPDYYNIGLLADVFSGLHANLVTGFKTQATAQSVEFGVLLTDFVQSLYTRKTRIDRAASLIPPERILANMAGNGDSKALFWLSVARGFGSPLLDRDLVLVLRPEGAMVAREIYDGEPVQGSHIVIDKTAFLLISLVSPDYAPAGVISLDEYRDLVNGRWKYQRLSARD